MASLLRPPGPPDRNLIGNMPMLQEDPLSIFARWAREYGDIFHYRVLHRHIYFINHPDLIKQVLILNAANFVKGDAVRTNRRIFGQGLVSNEGASWSQQRRLIQPAFHRSRIESYAQTMVAYAERTLDSWHDGQSLDIHQEMMRLALEIVAQALFSVEIASGDGERVSRALNQIMTVSIGPRLLLPRFLHRFPIPTNRKYNQAVDELDEVVFRMIGERQSDTLAPQDDLLATLLEARYEDGGAMSTQQLRDEVLTLLLAGHETTAVSLTWTWVLLSQHPEVERKLWAELVGVLNGRSPTVQDLPKLPYTDAIIKESMRLYPPVWAITRTAIDKSEIGGYRVPTGTTIVMSQWVMHRDPRFYEDPETFLPERWFDARLRTASRFTYFPFGGGPRVCIGSSFASVEAALLLATIAQKFQVRVTSPASIEPKLSITLRPNRDVPATLVKRR